MAEKSGREPQYIPDRGDIVWISLTPQAGYEQSGRRPALVLTPRSYNIRSRLALMCPITSRIKGYPFEVQLPNGIGVTGVVLADQVRSLDWYERQVVFIGRMEKRQLEETLELLGLLLKGEG